MKRSELRENIFKIVFSMTSFEELNEEILDYYIEDNEISEKDGKYIKDKVCKIKENLEKIDEVIKENARNYAFERISATTLSILRVAVYEITFEDDIPNGVSASEAVKLSEKYGEDKEKAFINGILGAYIRKLGNKE